jgi:hypothetical protein
MFTGGLLTVEPRGKEEVLAGAEFAVEKRRMADIADRSAQGVSR